MRQLLNVFVVLLVLAGSSFSATAIETPGEVVGQSGEYYLANDLDCTGLKTCIWITSSGVSLDLNGKRMYSTTKTGTGLLVSPPATTGALLDQITVTSTVQGAQIDGFENGIYTYDANTKITTPTNIDVNGNAGDGIVVGFSAQNSESGNIAINNVNSRDNGGSGLDVSDTFEATFDNIDTSGNLETGTIVQSSGTIYVQNSKSDNNLANGFTIFDTQDAQLLGVSTLSNANDGTHITNVLSLFGRNIDASSNGDDGIEIVDTFEATIDSTTTNDNFATGILVQSAETISTNDTQSNNNRGSGIVFVDTFSATADTIETSNNLEYGTIVQRVNLTLIKNAKSDNNLADGIFIVDASVVDLYDVTTFANEFHGVNVRTSGDVEAARVSSKSNGGSGFRSYSVDRLSLLDINTELNSDGLSTSLTRLGSGFRINSAKDDAAGLVIDSSSAFTIVNSSFLDSLGSGVKIRGSQNVLLDSVFANDNQYAGIEIVGSSQTKLRDTQTNNNEYGILVSNLIGGSLESVESIGNSVDGAWADLSQALVINDSIETICSNGRNGLTLQDSRNVLIDSTTLCNNTNAGIEFIRVNDSAVSDSNVYANSYGLLFDTQESYDEATLTGNVIEDNVVADIWVAGQEPDGDGDGVPDSQDQCPAIYGSSAYFGCPAAIECRITSNDVLGTGVPGQKPLEGALCKAYDRANTCVWTNHPDAQAVAEHCGSAGACVTDADGTCLMGLEEATYFVVALEAQHPGKYPAHDIGLVDSGNSPKTARLAFLKSPDGKTNPGRSSRKTGSEIWIYEPQYVIWNGTEEYYPFVFESDETWTVDVCVDPPQGYEVAGDQGCLQQLVAGEPKSILFKVVEVGSVPDDVRVRMSLTDAKGKRQQVISKVGTRLTQQLADAKGVAIDKNGVLRGGLPEEASDKAQGSGVPMPYLVALILGVGVFAFAVDAIMRKRR